VLKKNDNKINYNPQSISEKSKVEYVEILDANNL
jgi:hypothetical protein